jgi:hypothetical protein
MMMTGKMSDDYIITFFISYIIDRFGERSQICTLEAGKKRRAALNKQKKN